MPEEKRELALCQKQLPTCLQEQQAQQLLQRHIPFLSRGVEVVE